MLRQVVFHIDRVESKSVIFLETWKLSNWWLYYNAVYGVVLYGKNHVCLIVNGHSLDSSSYRREEGRHHIIIRSIKGLGLQYCKRWNYFKSLKISRFFNDKVNKCFHPKHEYIGSTMIQQYHVEQHWFHKTIWMERRHTNVPLYWGWGGGWCHWSQTIHRVWTFIFHHNGGNVTGLAWKWTKMVQSFMIDWIVQSLILKCHMVTVGWNCPHKYNGLN